MSIKLVAEVAPLHSRHVIVLANRSKRSVTEVVSLAVQEFLERNPVAGLESESLGSLLTHKPNAFTLAPIESDEPKIDPIERVATASRPKKVTEPLPGTPKAYKNRRLTHIDNVPLTYRVLRGEPQQDHINESARITSRAANEASVLQAALSQKVGHTFYPMDLFTTGAWSRMSVPQQRVLNKLVHETLTKCPSFRDLGLNSSRRHSYVYIGKQTEVN